MRRFDRGSVRPWSASGVLLVGLAIGSGCGPAVAEESAVGSGESSGGSTGPGSSASSAPQGDTSGDETNGEGSTAGATQGYCVVRATFWDLDGGDDAVPLLADVDGDGVTEVWTLREIVDGGWSLLGFEFQPSGGLEPVYGDVLNGHPTAFADVDGDGHDDAVLYRPEGSVWVSGGDTGLVPGSTAPLGDEETSLLKLGEFDGDAALDAIGLGGFDDRWILYAGDGAGGLDASDVIRRGLMTPEHVVAGPQDTLWVYATPVCLGFCPSHVEIVELRWQHPATAIVGRSTLEAKSGGFSFVGWVNLDSDDGPELLLLDGGTLLLGSAGAAGGELDFETLQEGAGRATHGDFDADGAIDVVTADADGGLWILWGSGAGLAEPQPLQGTASGALGTVADFNGDGSGEWLEYDASSPVGSQYAVVDIVPCP